MQKPLPVVRSGLNKSLFYGFFMTMYTGIDSAVMQKSFEKMLFVSKSPLKKCCLYQKVLCKSVIFVKKAINEKVKIF